MKLRLIGRASLVQQNWASWIRTSGCRDQNPVPYRLAIAQKGGYWDSNPGPSEPQSDALTNCAIPTIYEIRQAQSQTCSKGFEPPTHGLEGRCSIQLSYEHIPQRLFVKRESPARAGDGNRTHVSSLEGWCSTIELHPHISKIVCNRGDRIRTCDLLVPNQAL